MPSQSGRHCWSLSVLSLTQRFVLAAVVVKRDEQRNHRAVVGERLGVSIRQTSQAANVHPKRQVEPFSVACADPRFVWIAEAWDYFYAAYLGWRVSRFSLHCLVVFDDLGEVAAASKVHRHAVRVGAETIRRNLNAASCRILQPRQERIAG